MRKSVGFRVSEKAQELLGQLSEGLGISKTAAVELALREASRKHGMGAHIVVDPISDGRCEIVVYQGEVSIFRAEANMSPYSDEFQSTMKTAMERVAQKQEPEP